MKNLHLMTNQPKFVKSIVGFYDSNFLNDDHVIIVQYDNEHYYEVNSSEGEVDFTNKCYSSNELFQLMKEVDNIILHSMCLSFYKTMQLLQKKNILRKIVWIMYGADLYASKNSIKGMIRFIIRKRFYGRIKAIIAIFPTDIDEYYKRYKKCSKIFYAPYISGEVPYYVNMNYKKKCMAVKISDGEPIIIQVGHSASANVRHFEILDQIAKFKNENIRVLLPLSYGDVEYGDSIETYAKEIFGEKVIALRDFMSLEDYIELLSTVDIGIWNTHRQIGLGNINPHVYMGKKIYLSSDCIMNQFFKENNVPIFDSNSIDKFDDFISDVDDSVYDDFRNEYFDTESKIKKWEDIYRWLELNNTKKKGKNAK